MFHLYQRDIPERLIALSILPPPRAWESPRPFGFGAFVVTRQRRGEAAFSLYGRGFGAKHRPEPMREQLARLFTPDTTALIYTPVPEIPIAPWDILRGRSAAVLDWVPRSGLRSNAFAAVPHHVLLNAANIIGVTIATPATTPLSRLCRVGGEAQAAWAFWLHRRCPPRLRRDLLASFEAWREINRARR